MRTTCFADVRGTQIDLTCLIYCVSIVLSFNFSEIPISNTTCDVFPLAHRPRYYSTDDIPTPSNYSINFGNLSIRFHGDEASVFTTYINRAGQRVEFKREYVSIKAYPLSEQYGEPGSDFVRTFGRPRWSTFVLETPTKLRVNTSTIDNVLIMEYIFEYKQDKSSPYLKLSYAAYSTPTAQTEIT